MCVQRTCYEQVQKVFAELLMDRGVPNFLHNIHIVVFVSHQLANTAYNVILSFPTLQFQRFLVFFNTASESGLNGTPNVSVFTCKASKGDSFKAFKFCRQVLINVLLSRFVIA